MQKRGLSGIVVSILLILLALVAVVVIWVLINNFLGKSASGINLGRLTANVQIDKLKTTYSPSTKQVTITVSRKAGQGDVVGVKFILSNGSKEFEVDKNDPIKEQESKTYTLDYSSQFPNSNLQKVTVIPLLKSGSKTIPGNIPDEQDLTDIPACGNSVKEGSEECDGGTTETCTSIGLGFNGGTLSCNLAQCKFDTSLCTRCGDTITQPPQEICDSNSQSCNVGGYTGTQTCKSDCTGWNTCSPTQSCGDGVLQLGAGETCDDGNVANNDGCDSACHLETAKGALCDVTVNPTKCTLPVLFLKFDGNYQDSSPYANHGTPSGTPITTTDSYGGKSQTVLSLNGAGSYLTIPSVDDSSLSFGINKNFSVSFWSKGLSVFQPQKFIFGSAYYDVGNGFCFYTTTGVFSITNGSTDHTAPVDSPAPIDLGSSYDSGCANNCLNWLKYQPNQWVYTTFVVTRGNPQRTYNTTVTEYIHFTDGVTPDKVASVSYPNTWWDDGAGGRPDEIDDLAPYMNLTSPRNLLIGTSYAAYQTSPVVDSGYFSGYIDDFRIYNRTLTTTEIQNIYTGTA